MSEYKKLPPSDASATEDYFVNRVDVLDNECWLWLGSFAPPTEHNGYKHKVPLMWITAIPKGYSMFAHRYAYGKRIGELPPSKTHALVRLCETELCVNPQHHNLLRRKSLADNARPSRLEAARNAPMCKNGIHKRTPENIVALKNGKKLCLPCYKKALKEANARYYLKKKALKSESEKPT